MKRISMLYYVLLAFYCCSLSAQTIIARWDFDDEDAIVDEGAGIFSIDDELGGQAYYSGNGGNAIAYTSWNTSDFDVNSDYVQIQISTLNMYQIKFSFDSYRTSTGPSQYCITASVDNFNSYDQIQGGSLGVAENWQSFSNISLDNSFANQSNLLIRIYGYQASAWQGRLRLDNISVTGDPEQSLPVMCSTFQAIQSNNQVVLCWKTESEVDVEGFYLLRSEDENGNYQYITNELILSQSNGSSGNEYQFVDYQIQSDKIYWYQIEVLNQSGKSQIIGPICSMVETVEQINSEFQLMPGFPNPFNPSITIPYNIPINQKGHPVVLKIYNVLGNEIVTLYRGIPDVGLQYCNWNGCDAQGSEVANGLYIIYFLSNNCNLHTQQILKVK